MKKLITLQLCMCIVITCTMAQSVIRGPYLQKASSSRMTIKWRTSSPTQSVVHYGTNPTNLNLTKTSSSLKIDHELELFNLNPNTIYYYDIANANSILVNGSADLYFKTHPTIGNQGDYKFWVLGDCGTGNSDQRDVRDAYYNHIGNNHTDGILFLGDNAYNSGEDSEYQGAIFQNMYEDKLKNTIAWSCLGNHDGYTANSNAQTGPYYDIFTFPTNGESGGVASGTEAYYSFDYGNIHFIVLDSYETNRWVGSTMYNWAQNDIQNTNQDWIIAFWHHPPYTKGSHDSDDPQYDQNLIDMRENFLPMLESNGVDLILSGHSHSYERSYFINGHYGYSNSFDASQHIVGINGGGDGKLDGNGAYSRATTTTNEGAVYVVAGSSGKIQTFGPLDHEAMFYGVEELGSCALEVNGDELTLKFIRENGNILDYFTIDKNLLNCNPGTPCNDNNACTTNDTYDASCNCVGISSLDSDNDGICNAEDCDPFNAQLPGTPGASCNDGNANTSNDVILADGCSCEGTPVSGCNVSVSVSNNTITISGLTGSENAKIFNTSWQPQWSCNPWQGNSCTPNETHVANNGTYYVSVQSSTCDFFEIIAVSGADCTDQDNDGICADQDCDDSNALLPASPGSTCNDGDSSTTNDIIQSDGCTCMGTQPNGCNVAITSNNGFITITGAAGTNTKIFNTSWQDQWSCNPWQGNPCSNLESYASGVGTFYVSSQSAACNFFEVVTVTNSGGCPDSDNDGVCDINDCAPNNPNLPASPGDPCNDFDVATINDVIQSDGCTCAGMPDNSTGSDCNITYATTSNSVTFNGLTDPIVTVNIFGSNYTSVFNCGTWSTPCNPTESVTSLPPGSYKLVYESFDSGWNKLCEVDQDIQLSNSPMIDNGEIRISRLKAEQSLSKNFNLFPNPAIESLNIEVIDFAHTSVNIDVTDAFGKRIYSNKIKQVEFPIYEVDIKSFPAGVYNLCVQGEATARICKSFVVGK